MIKSLNDIYKSLFIESYFYLKNNKAYINDENKESVFLQLLLNSSAFVYGTKLASALFWNIKLNSQSQFKIDISQIPESTTLIQKKSRDEILKQYLNHYFLSRTISQNYLNTSIAKILFNDIVTNINWVFKPAHDNFSIEIRDDLGEKMYVVFNIPKYYNDNPEQSLQKEIKYKSDGYQFAIFNDFELVHLEDFIKNENFFSSLTQHDSVPKYNSDYINIKDIDKIKAEIKIEFEKSANDQIFKELLHSEKKRIIDEFAEKIPYYAYLVQLGECVYITNSVLTHNKKTVSSSNGGIFLIEDEINLQDEFTKVRFAFISDVLDLYSELNVLPKLISISLEKDEELRYVQTRSAIQSILLDSYAHNVSAHSLNFLQQFFNRRNEEFLKKNYTLVSFDRLKDLPVNEVSYFNFFEANKQHIEKDEKGQNKEDLNYYTTLGQHDSTNTLFYANLLDYIQHNPGLKNKAHNLLQYEDGDGGKWPMPLDYAIAPLLTYLRDKGAFWSGIIRDNKATPSQFISFYDVLMEMCSNPLFLGSIMAAEGIFIIHVFVNTEYAGKDGNEYNDVTNTPTHFLTINIKDFVKAEFDEKYEPKEIDTKYAANFLNDTDTTLSFVRLTKGHQKLRQILQTQTILLPGGLVGKHALFTIIENTLRNAKHLKNEHRKQIQRNGLELHFYIREEKFEESEAIQANNTGENSGERELYRVGIHLNYELDISSAPIENNQEKQEKLIKSVIRNSYKPILSEDGKPNMGGSSQDKICAAALFNGNFTAVEYPNKEVNNWYPWIHYNLCPDDAENVDITEHSLYEELRGKEWPEIRALLEDDQLKNLVKKYDSTLGNKHFHKDLYVKFFHVWKGQDVFIFEDEVKTSGGDNFIYSIPRYKIGVLKTGIRNSFRTLREQAVIRLVFCEESPKDIYQNIGKQNQFAALYKVWNTRWLGKNGEDFNSSLFIHKGSAYYEISFDEQELSFTKQDNPSEADKNSSIEIDHDKGAERGDVCKLRSHGYFMKYFMEGKTLSQIFTDNAQNSPPQSCTEKKENERRILKQELFETIFTHITLVDNRLFDLVKNYKFEGQKIPKYKSVLRKKLNLSVFNENDNLNALIRKAKRCNKKHFYIFHLSYVEKIIKDNPDKFDKIENTIEKFIELVFEFGHDSTIPLNFIVGMTTGRGREEWLKKTGKYRSHCIHIPIESLQTAIQQGVIFKDDFDIKYNLCKVLFGS